MAETRANQSEVTSSAKNQDDNNGSRDKFSHKYSGDKSDSDSDSDSRTDDIENVGITGVQRAVCRLLQDASEITLEIRK